MSNWNRPSQKSGNTLVFDIETVGLEFGELDRFSKEYIEFYAENEADLKEAKESLGISPLTGKIVAIGVLNPDTNKGVIYVNSMGSQLPESLTPNIALISGTEAFILEKFWEAASKYSTFVSFNGRGFDAPYLALRSAINGIRPLKDLMANRYLSSQHFDCQHIDLLDQLTFYRALRGRSSLHFFCKAFGIKSPKEDGTTGLEVAELVRDGKFVELAKYNYGDLIATKELYERWKKYLA